MIPIQAASVNHFEGKLLGVVKRGKILLHPLNPPPAGDTAIPPAIGENRLRNPPLVEKQIATSLPNKAKRSMSPAGGGYRGWTA